MNNLAFPVMFESLPAVKEQYLMAALESILAVAAARNSDNIEKDKARLVDAMHRGLMFSGYGDSLQVVASALHCSPAAVLWLFKALGEYAYQTNLSGSITAIERELHATRQLLEGVTH